MRSRVFSFLLSLSLIVCVGFGSSLTASAANTEPVDFMWFNNTYTTNESWSGFSENGFARVHFNKDVNIFIPEQIDSTLYFSVYSRVGVTQTQGTLYVYDNSGNLINTITPDKSFAGVDEGDAYISFSVYSFSGQFLKFDLPSDSSTWDVVFSLSREMPSSSGNSEVIAAIQDQTSDIQQSIEDQYSGDPDQSFNIDDIVTQHNEKMGVLSFSSDVMMDLLGLLSPDQSLSSELVFPSMSLKIANQRQTVQLWPEYRFDLEELAGHWPFLINLMRSITTASVWLLVLRYCYKVFDKYFLAGGS